MPTSELSNALNPYVSQRAPVVDNYFQLNSAVSFQASQHHVPHVSELDLAIVEPPPPPIRSTHGAQILTELVRRVTETQRAHEIEQRRRLAWEREQDAKAAQNQAETDKKLQNMLSEIAMLRSTIDTLCSQRQSQSVTNGLLTPQYTSSPSLSQSHTATLPASPISPLSCPSYSLAQGFPSESVSNSICNHYSGSNSTQSSSQQSVPYVQTQKATNVAVHSGTQSFTPNASPHLMFVNVTGESPYPPGRAEKRKRRRSFPEFSEDGNSSSSCSSAISCRPRKRVSHHDTRCYTIHHAIRIHILKMMGIENDRDLPDSHPEGAQIPPSQPVRFMWDKTTKQSVHNSRMKFRILEDIKDNRRHYKYVPTKEFTKKNLDTAFDQCFLTLRQKFRTQRDSKTASFQRIREEVKTRKARHLSRRNAKLSRRSEARNKISMFEHVTFDGALQVDCMSSEESDYECGPESSQQCNTLKTHGYSWRSSRLLQFYCTLDDEDKVDSTAKAKRGSGKKERRVGSNKEEFILPPEGVATWMISRRWYKASLATHQDLPNNLSKLIKEEGFNWQQFSDLGGESADEDENENINVQQHNV